MAASRAIRIVENHILFKLVLVGMALIASGIWAGYGVSDDTLASVRGLNPNLWVNFNDPDYECEDAETTYQGGSYLQRSQCPGNDGEPCVACFDNVSGLNVVPFGDEGPNKTFNISYACMGARSFGICVGGICEPEGTPEGNCESLIPLYRDQTY